MPVGAPDDIPNEPLTAKVGQSTRENGLPVSQFPRPILRLIVQGRFTISDEPLGHMEGSFLYEGGSSWEDSFSGSYLLLEMTTESHSTLAEKKG